LDRKVIRNRKQSAPFKASMYGFVGLMSRYIVEQRNVLHVLRNIEALEV
jgi:hypothetical protein